MDVNATSAVNTSYPVQQTNKPAEENTKAAATVAAEEKKETAAVVYEKEDKKDVGKYVPDKKQIEKLLKEAEDQTTAFKAMIQKLLQKQGNKYKESQGISFETTGIINKNDIKMLDVDSETQAAAKEAISEDGYYGVKKTSQRILDFAKALSGGDPSKIETLKKAVIKGFEEAEKLWGDKLPQISKDTYDAVMAGFDAWEKGE